MFVFDVLDMIYNLSFLIVMSIFVIMLIEKIKLPKFWNRIVAGLLFGLIAVIDMCDPIQLLPGVAVDGRTIIVSISAFFFGPWVGLISSILVLVFRAILGGAGLIAAYISIAFSFLMGSLFYVYHTRHKIDLADGQKFALPSLVLGFIVHVFCILFIFVFTDYDASQFFSPLSITFVLSCTIGSYLFGLLLQVWKSRAKALSSSRKNEEEYRILVEEQSDLLIKVNFQNKILYANKNFCQTFGVEEHNILGESYIPSLKDHTAFNFNEIMEELFKPPYKAYRELEMLTTNGWRWFGWLNTPIIRDGHVIPEIISVGRDVTARKHIELKLDAMKCRYQNLVNSSPDAILVELNEEIILANLACVNMLGYEQESDLLGKNPLSFVLSGEDLDFIGKAKKSLITSAGTIANFETRIRKNNGSIIDVEVRETSFNIEGQTGLHVILRDVTQRKANEYILYRQRQRLELAEEMAGLGSFEVNYISGERWWSDQMSRFVNQEPSSIFPLDEEIIDMTHPDDVAYIKNCVLSFRKGKKPEEKDFRTNPKYGKTRYMMPIWRITFDDKGEVSVISGTILDVTERRKIEQQLREREEDLSLTLMSIEDAVISTDIEGRITRMNRVAESLIGLKFSDVEGQAVNAIFNPIDGTTRLPLLNSVDDIAVVGKEIKSYNNLIFVSQKGKEFNIEGSIAPILDNRNNYRGYIVTFSDVSERFRNQKLLDEERLLLRSVIDGLPFSLYIKDTQSRKLLANKKELEYLGLPLEKAIGKTDYELYPKDYADSYMRDDVQVLSGQAISDRLECLPDKNGKEMRWISTTKLPLYDMGGKVSGILGFGIDVTQTVDADRKIRLLTQGVEQSPAAIVITNLNGEVEYVNSRYEEMTGLKFPSICGKMPDLLNKCGENRDLASLIWNNISIGRKWEGEYLYMNGKNRKTWQSVQISPILDEAKVKTNYIIVIEDISGQKKMLNDLIQARKKAEENDRLKSSFLANMSHEIRTPMNGILGFSDLLRDPHLTGEEQSYYIDLIEKSGQRMLNIINDIIDISKIEAGQMVVTFVPTNINEVLDYLHSFFAPEATSKNVDLELLMSLPDDQAIIMTDKFRFSQVMTNLIKNALKFTTSGQIKFGYTLERQVLIFYVKDTGVGIEPEKVEKVFERFVQGDLILTRKYEGAGLGLSISKALVEKMGGHIWVESTVGVGSVFRFTLPYCVPRDR